MSYAKERKILTPILRKLADRDRKSLNHRDFSAAEQVLARWGRKPKKLDPKLHKKLIEQRSEKQSSRASHNQETAAIREAVLKRAHWCEACDDPETVWEVLQMDHWLGGWGRRKQEQSVETCWALCMTCHRERTENKPSAAAWNERFAAHCKKHGYSFTPHIIHAEPAKAGGAP